MEPGVIVSKAFESPGEVMSRELPAGRAVQFMAKGDLSGCQVLGADFSHGAPYTSYRSRE
jgi:hypothetical protein